MTYTTLADVQTFLGVPATVDTALLGAYIQTAEHLINAYCGRSFEAATDTTRMLNAHPPTVYGQTLYLDDDLCQITQIINGDGTIIASTGYRLEPDVPPYQRIILTDASRAVWTWQTDAAQAIAITGRWAYAITAPSVIAHATQEIVAWLYRSYDTQGQQPSASPAADQHGELPPIVRALLSSYQRLI